MVPPSHVAFYGGRPPVVDAVFYFERGHQHGVVKQVGLYVPRGGDVFAYGESGQTVGNLLPTQGFGTGQAVGALPLKGGLPQGFGLLQRDSGQAVGAQALQAVTAHLFGEFGCLRTVAVHILQPHEGHNVFHSLIRRGGVAGAVVVFLHPVVGDEPRLHVVATLFGGSQVGLPGTKRTTKSADLDVGFPRFYIFAVLIDKLGSQKDGLIVSFVVRIESTVAWNESEQDGSVVA